MLKSKQRGSISLPRGPFLPAGEQPTFLRGKARFLSTKKIPKSNGTYRHILVPRGKLRELQDAALLYLTSKIPGTKRYPFFLLAAQTAFKRGASAYNNAQRHAGFAVSVKFDIKKFFDSIPASQRKGNRVNKFFTRKLKGHIQYRKDGKIVRSVQRKCGYKIVVKNAVECLVGEGVPEDIAKFIADISSFRGYLYQGSPLSPLLANLVTKHCLVPRLLKLASAYDLPVFCVKGRGFVVVSHDGFRVWYHGLDPNGEELRLLRKLASEGHRHAPCPAGWTTHTLFEKMEKEEEGETVREMVLRYAQGVWTPRKPGFVKLMRRYMVREVRDLGTEASPNKVSLEFRDVIIPPWAKCVFTLYADDGMFSSNNRQLHQIKWVLRRVLECCGFRANAKKGIRVMRRGRYVTGYEVSEAPAESLDHGPRIDHKTRDQKFRRPLHHMKTGRLPVNSETVHMFNGRLAWLKQSNPNWWQRFAIQFKDLVLQAASAMDNEEGQWLADQVERYRHL